MYGQNDPVSTRSAESLLRTAARPSESFAYAGTTESGMALVREKQPELLARAIAWIERTL